MTFRCHGLAAVGGSFLCVGTVAASRRPQSFGAMAGRGVAGCGASAGVVLVGAAAAAVYAGAE